MRSPTVTFVVLAWALSLSYVKETGGAVLGNGNNAGDRNGIRNANGGYNVPQPNLPALYSAPKTRQEQEARDLEQDQQPTSTDRDSTTTEIYFDNNNSRDEDDDSTSDDYQFASTGTTPGPQNDYPNAGYTTINPTEPIRQGYAGYVNNEGKSLDQNTARPLDQQQIENQLFPRQQQISPEQRTTNGRSEYGPPSSSSLPQQFPPQLPFVNQDRGSQYLPPNANAGSTNNRPEPYTVPQNAISLPNKGTFDEQTSQRSRIGQGGETTQQPNFPRVNNDPPEQQQQQQQTNINYYNDGQRGIGGENRYLPPAEHLPREQSLPASSSSHGQQQPQQRRQEQQLFQGEDQIRSPQQYYGTAAFHNFQPQRTAYERPQQGQQQQQQVNQPPQLQYLEQPQREQYQPQEQHQQQKQSQYQPQQQIQSQQPQQQQFPSPQYQQQPAPQYKQEQRGPQYEQQQPSPQYPEQQQSGPQYQLPPQSTPQYQQPQQSSSQYQQPAPQYQQQQTSPQQQQPGASYPQQQQPSPQYQQQTPSPQYQPQPQSTPSYQQQQQQPGNQYQQQQPASQYQQQQQSIPGYQQQPQQTPYQQQAPQQPNQQPQNQQYPATDVSKVNPPSSTPPSHGFEFDDHFGENDNVVDADLLLRVQKIIEDHERQQNELREKSRRENEYFQDNSLPDNQLSYSSGNPSNQGYYNENPGGSFLSNAQSSQPVHHEEYRKGDNRLENSPHSQSIYPAQQGANKYSFPSAAAPAPPQLQQDSQTSFNNPEINREQKNNGDLGFQQPTQLGGQPLGYQISNAPITATTTSTTSPKSNSIDGGRREYSNEKSTAINPAPYIEYQKAILTDHFVETRPEFPSQRSQYLPPPPSPPQSPEKAGEDSVFISNPQIASFPSPLVSTKPGNHPSNEIVQPENQQLQQQQQPLPQQQQQPIAYNQNRVENIHFPSPNNNGQSPSQIYSSQEQLLTSQPEYHQQQYNSNNNYQGVSSDQATQPPLQSSNAYVQSFPQQNPVLSFLQYGGNPSSNAIEISPNVHAGFVQTPLPQEQDQQQQSYVPQQQEPVGNSYPESAAPVNQQQNQRTIIVHEVPYGTVQGVTNRAVISPNDFTFSRENKLNVDGNQNSFSPGAPPPSSSTSSNNDFSSANEDSFVQDSYRSPLVSQSQPQHEQQQGREANSENSQFPNNQQLNVNGQERDLQSSYLPQTETASQQVQTWPSVHSINNVVVDTPKPVYGIPLAPVVDPDYLNLSNNDASLYNNNNAQGSIGAEQTNNNNNNQFFPVQAYSQQQQQQQQEQPQEQIYLQSNKYFLPQPVLFVQDGNNLDFNGQPPQQQQQQPQQQLPQIIYGTVADARDSNAWNPDRNSVIAYQSSANVQEVNQQEVGNSGNFNNNINEYGSPSSVVRSQELATQGYLYPRRYRSIKRIRRIRKPVTPSSVSVIGGEDDATKQ